MPESQRATAHTLPISQAHLASLGFDPNYGHSPRSSSEFFETTPSLTPTSTTGSSLGGFGIAPVHTPQQRPGQAFPGTPLGSLIDPAGLNVPLSDVNAMMFPSADPFAYPNQPMTTFENNHPQDFGVKIETSPTIANLPFQVPGNDLKSHAAGFSPGGMGVPIGPRRAHDSDVQLFGPMPMYLMHGAQQQGQRQFAPPNPQAMQMAGTPEAGNMNFDDLFGGEEWANTFMDQGLGLSGGRAGFAGTPGFGSSGGPGMQNWR